jgi:hypothetical protein
MRIEASALHAPPAKPKPFYRMLYVQVLVGLTLGILTGYLWPDFGAALKPLGDGFVKLVKMMIAPIVFCTIVGGITSLNDTRGIGRTLLKAMALFYALTILALVAGAFPARQAICRPIYSTTAGWWEGGPPASPARFSVQMRFARSIGAAAALMPDTRNSSSNDSSLNRLCQNGAAVQRVSVA